MKNYMIKTSFVSPKGPKARANQTGVNFLILIFNPAESNCFRSNTGKFLLYCITGTGLDPGFQTF